MTNEQSFVSPRENDVGDIYASTRILSIIGNLGDFREWLRKEKAIQVSEQLVIGTGFFFEVALLSFALSVRFDSSLRLTESRAFSRADFHGDIDIEEIPNDCEKTILLKRVKTTLKSVRKCKSWNDLERVIADVRSLIDPIREIIEEPASPGLGLSLQAAKDFITKKHLLVFFQESEKGLPKACLLSPLLPYRSGSVFFADVFCHYVLCLEFVWRDILGAAFKNSMMSKIQEGLLELKPLAEKHLSAEESWFDDFPLAKLSDLVEIPMEQREEAKDDRSSPRERDGFVSWLSLDMFSTKVHQEELVPFEKSLGSTGWASPALTVSEADKSALESLLSKKGVSEPSYFCGNDWKSKRRRLDYYYLWYPLEVLDASHTEIFKGVPAFLSVVMGACRLRDISGGDSPIEVRVFKHPVRKFEVGFEYSYAVLIEVSGGLSDHSGWLVFNDCTGEYSGHPEYECLLARKTLDIMEKHGDIRQVEITIDSSSFRRYLQENGRVTAETARGATLMQSRDIIKSQRDIIEALRGKFFEYVFYRWLTMQGGYIDVKGPGEFKDVQIDCLGIRESDIDVYECKIKLHGGIDDVGRQIRAEEEAIRGKFPQKTTHAYVAVYHKVDTLDRLGLEHQGIGVIDDFKSRIRNMDIHSSDRHDILRILDFDVARIIE